VRGSGDESALAVALADEETLCRAGRVAEHDKLYDPVLMATMDKTVEGRADRPSTAPRGGQDQERVDHVRWAISLQHLLQGMRGDDQHRSRWTGVMRLAI
jgi:hypothetical protein